MPTKIHAQAIVEEGAQLGENVIVEAFALIGKSAIIGDHSIIRHHATVEGKVVLGKGNEIYPYALIGGLTHDLKFNGGEPELHVGDNNTFREYVTAHVATKNNDISYENIIPGRYFREKYDLGTVKPEFGSTPRKRQGCASSPLLKKYKMMIVLLILLVLVRHEYTCGSLSTKY